MRKEVKVNENFFENWSPEMAYILGYFAADGCMFINPRGSHYIDFTSTDLEIIEKIQRIMKSDHSIGRYKPSNKKWKIRYRLQLGSKKIFKDLLQLGFVSNKSNSIKFPEVPCKYLSFFIRGYFDGDGGANFYTYPRKTRESNFKILSSRFTSGNKKFLKSLLKILRREADLKGGFIYKKNRGFELSFSIRDSIKLFNFIYKDTKKDLYLKRKYYQFKNAIKKWQNSLLMTHSATSIRGRRSIS